MNINDGTPPPVPAGEEKQWADLAAEAADDLGEEAAADGHGEGGGDKQASSTDESDATAEQAKQPIPYEELERRHRQTAGALKETREREQAARDQLKAFTNMVEEMRSQRKPAAEDTKQPDPEIDPNEDPIGYFQQRIAKLEAQLTETHKSATETREEARSRQEYQSFLGEVSKHEDAFKATTPDYHDAAEYLEKGRRAELQVMFPDSEHFNRYAQQQGYKSAAHLREAIFVNDAQTVARNALMAGMNPAEAYYELAKGRGYKPGNGGGAPAEKVATANGVIDAMRRGTKASKTLSGGGGAPDNPLNIADLTDLYAEDPEEFDKQWEKMARAGKLG